MQTEELSDSGNTAHKNDAVVSTVNSNQSESRARVSKMYRQSNVAAARKDGDLNTLHITADSMFLSINHRYKNSQNSIEIFDWDMHDLWHTYYIASKHISAQHPAQDRLVLQIVALKGQGVLTRTKPHGADEATTSIQAEEALTSDGRIWADLPFLARDMAEYWVTDFPKMSAAQRLGFSQFVARLASLGLAPNDSLCSIGLMVLRDTFETTRLLGEGLPGQGVGDQEEDDGRRNQDISIAALLPAANSWLFWAGAKLIQLSDQNWNSGASESETTTAGELFGSSTKGFSPERWMYWLQRIQEIAESGTTQSKELSDYAGRMAENMYTAAEDADHTSLVRRAVHDWGAASQRQKHL